MGALVVPIVLVVLIVRRARARHGDARATVLRHSAFGLMVAFSGLFGLFLIGETFDDPGGWRALVMVATWLVPLAALTALGRWRPRTGRAMLDVAITAVVVMSLWFAADPQGWRTWEDGHGPLRVIASFAVSVPLAVVGLREPRGAGWRLVTVTAGPVLLAALAAGMAPTVAGPAVVLSIPFVSGVLDIAAARIRPSRPRHPQAAA